MSEHDLWYAEVKAKQGKHVTPEQGRLYCDAVVL